MGISIQTERRGRSASAHAHAIPLLTDETVQRVESEASTTEIAKVALYLQGQLGQKMTAYLAGINDPKMVGKWIRGRHQPRQDVAMRLRSAFEVTRLLVEGYNAETAKAWLLGSNSRLDGEAPAYLLRHAESVDDIRFVVPVAVAFVGGTG